jgi:hypothetical protein
MTSFFISILFAPFGFQVQTPDRVLQSIVGHVEAGPATASCCRLP